MKRDGGGLAVPQAKRHRGEQQPKLGWFLLSIAMIIILCFLLLIETLIVFPSSGQPFPVPLASLTGVESSNEVWAVYRGRLERHVNGTGPEGRNATVVVVAEEEIEALQVHGCFGGLVDVNWKDVARTQVEEWRPGEEEDDNDEDKKVIDSEDRKAHEAESWSDVKDREDEEDFIFEKGIL